MDEEEIEKGGEFIFFSLIKLVSSDGTRVRWGHGVGEGVYWLGVGVGG